MNRLQYYLWLLAYVVCFYAVFVVVKMLTLIGIPNRKRSLTTTRVLFLECMGPPSAGFRHRSKGWVNELRNSGIRADSWYVMPYAQQWRLQQTKIGMLRLHMIYLITRLGQILKSASYDAVVVRREVLLYNDYGNLFFEKWLRAIHTNLILDVDDDISAAKREPRPITNFGRLMLEHPQKFKSSLQYLNHVIVASDYLKELFLSWNNGLVEENISVVPTCVDYHKHEQKDYSRLSDSIVVGWVGSAYNLFNLYAVYPALESLAKRYPIKLLVVCNQAPKAAGFDIDFMVWNEANELNNLLKIDIGIMPLVDTNVSKGKGGFKLIQYMGCGVVSVATALTINRDIVRDGDNGFLVHHQGDWENVLEKVIKRRNDFAEIGRQASETVQQRYSYEANLPIFLKAVGVSTTAHSHQPV